MTFNSLQFALFFTAILLIYLVLDHKRQNGLLLVASCIFYCAWDWRFLPLVFVSITTDYLCGLKIKDSSNEGSKRLLLVLSVIINISILGFFKYFNFFASGLIKLMGIFGIVAHPYILKIILPLGISFYTFKTMSYVIDVYTGKTEPTRSYPDYALFVLFFPVMPSGPIMRAESLLSQISLPRQTGSARLYEGLHFIFWGLFQKMFIADNLARIANQIFSSSAPYDGAFVIVAMYAFAFQIYCDFAGYSNMAIGLGRCLGFDISTNFNIPYLAVNAQDFWRRWHMTLSAWLRDYIYTPLTFIWRRMGKAGVTVSLMVTFILCGLWHGAAWTFVLWGLYQGALLVVHQALAPSPGGLDRSHAKTPTGAVFFLKAIIFFHLTCIGWLIFRAHTISQAAQLYIAIFSRYTSKGAAEALPMVPKIIFYIWPLVFIELIQFFRKDELWVMKASTPLRISLYLVLLYLLVSFGVVNSDNFIYARF